MKTIVAIGGGELKDRTTLKIDEYIVSLAKKRAKDKRAFALFIPTASGDFMPYYNTFHKVYTGVFDVKTDVALSVYRSSTPERLKEKFEKADLIYVGGGNTVFMLEKWKESGFLELIKDAYERGVIIAGLSAGAICWWNKMYTDSANVGEYSMHDGLGWIDGIACPHYNVRQDEFDQKISEIYQNSANVCSKRDNEIKNEPIIAYAMEDNSALVIVDGQIERTLSSGGKVYKFYNGEKIQL